MTARADSILSFIARHGLHAELGRIPWEEVPADLRHACDEFLSAWWEALSPDEPIHPSGLLGMTVSQILEIWSARRHDDADARDTLGLQRRYHVVSYLRCEPEDAVPVSLAEALSELDQLQLLAPESVHRLEEVCQVIVASEDPAPQG